MMDPLLLALLLFFGGVLLLIAEVFLPAHGLVGLAGALSMLAGIGLCFRIDPWLGLTVFLVVLIASPFVGAMVVKLYPHTPIGRRLVLRPIESAIRVPLVKVGQAGVAVSELRPMGMCEFGNDRVEAIAEHGLVRAGTPVRIVAIIDNRPTVRAM
jgi:membrane-bound ClpP family serine protease